MTVNTEERSSRSRQKTYRVIQWATGTMGSEALRLVLDRPDLELAGVYVYSGEKQGKDAGELCGRKPTGVKATSKREEILALDADVVLHMPMLEPTTTASDGEIVELLRSGKNVISIRGYLWPLWRNTAYARQFEDACRSGNSTLLGTGINPGFLFDRVAVTLTSMCSALRAIRCYEGFDVRTRPPHTIFDVVGMGKRPDDLTLESPLARTLNELFTEMFHLLAEQLGTKVVTVKLDLEHGLAQKDIPVPGGIVPEGTVAAVGFLWKAELDAGPRIEFESRWFVDRSIPGWDFTEGWRVVIDGEPSVKAQIALGESFLPGAQHGRFDPTHRGVTALALNAIPEVCAAPAGILRPKIFAPWQARV